MANGSQRTTPNPLGVGAGSFLQRFAGMWFENSERQRREQEDQQRLQQIEADQITKAEASIASSIAGASSEADLASLEAVIDSQFGAGAERFQSQFGFDSAGAARDRAAGLIENRRADLEDEQIVAARARLDGLIDDVRGGKSVDEVLAGVAESELGGLSEREKGRGIRTLQDAEGEVTAAEEAQQIAADVMAELDEKAKRLNIEVTELQLQQLFEESQKPEPTIQDAFVGLMFGKETAGMFPDTAFQKVLAGEELTPEDLPNQRNRDFLITASNLIMARARTKADMFGVPMPLTEEDYDQVRHMTERIMEFAQEFETGRGATTGFEANISGSVQAVQSEQRTLEDVLAGIDEQAEQIRQRGGDPEAIKAEIRRRVGR